jgi:hypothetical protein
MGGFGGQSGSKKHMVVGGAIPMSHHPWPWYTEEIGQQTIFYHGEGRKPAMSHS